MLPALFLSHGSPMLAIATPDADPYVKALGELGNRVWKPNAMLFISSHWYASGNFVDVSAKPRTIYDFYGFPESLSKITYPAPWFPAAAAMLDAEFGKGFWKPVERGLDHAVWTTLRHLYPNADVPVATLSVNSGATPEELFEIWRKLRSLRKRNVLVIWGWNVVHDLATADFSRGPWSEPHPFAKDFDEAFASALAATDYGTLLRPESLQGWSRSVPTPDHYLPVDYVLGASYENETPETIFEGFELGSIGRRAFGFGLPKARS